LSGELSVSHLRLSPRPYPERLPVLAYSKRAEKRRVHRTGEIKWQGTRLFVSETLAREWVALQEIEDGVWSLEFAHIELGRYNERTKGIS